jgi:hypothetical protein
VRNTLSRSAVSLAKNFSNESFMEENKSTENTNTAGESSKPATEPKTRGNFFRGRGSVIALTAIIALIVGFAIGHHMHHRHRFEGRWAWGGAPMMMRGGGGPGGQCYGPRSMRGMAPMGMHHGMGMGPGMGMQGMGMQGMRMRQGFDPSARADRMKEELGLTDQQTQQIESIFAQQKQRMESAMNGTDSSRRQDFQSARDQIHSQISAILTPEQRTKWEQFMAGRMAQP